MDSILDSPRAALFVERIYIQHDEKDIFEQIWHNIYRKSEGGSKEVVALNNLRLLSERLKETLSTDNRDRRTVERIIDHLEGPVFIFAELPALYTATAASGDQPDSQRFANADTYFTTMEGGRDNLVEIAKRSLAKISSAIIFFEQIFPEPEKTEYVTLFKDFAQRIADSNVISKFKALKEPSAGWSHDH